MDKELRLKKTKNIERYLLLSNDFDKLDEQIKELLAAASTSRKPYLTKRQIENLMNKFKKIGWDVKFWDDDDACIVGFLRSPDEIDIDIVRGGRTTDEIIQEVWTWIKKNKDKKLRLIIEEKSEEKSIDSVFTKKFLQLFRIIDSDKRGWIVQFHSTKKNLVDFIKLLSNNASIEYCYYRISYIDEWGLFIKDRVVNLWRNFGINGNQVRCNVMIEVWQSKVLNN